MRPTGNPADVMIPPSTTLPNDLPVDTDVLRASEIRYRRLFEAARDGILLLDAVTLKITDVNPFMIELLGYSFEEFLGKELWEIGFFSDRTASQEAFRDLQLTGYLRYDDLPLRTRIGKIREVEFVSNLYEEDGSRVIQCNIRDITERKRIEILQMAMEDRYHTLFDYAPDGIVIADQESSYIDANSSMCRMLGYPRDEFIGLSTSDIVTYPDADHIATVLDTVKESAGYHGEWQFRRKDDSVFSGEVMATLMPDGNLLAMVRDITSRKLTESENASLTGQIETHQNRLDKIVANVPGIVWERSSSPASLGTSNTFVSEYVLPMLGYSVEEWLATPNIWLSIVHPDDRDRVAQKAREAFERGESSVDEFRWTTQDGRTIWVESHSAIIFDAAPKPCGVRGVTIDITDRKQSEIERRIITEIIQGVITTPNLDEFLKLVHSSIRQAVYAENCFIMLRDSVTGIDHTEFWVDKYDPPPAAHSPGRGFGSYVVRSGRPLRITEEIKQKLIAAGEAEQIGSFSPSWLGVPLRTPAGLTIGVLVLQHYEEANAFSERDLEFLTSVGDHVAKAIERKRAEDAVRESEERYRELVENAIDIIYTHDLTGNFTTINKAWEKSTGYTREETLTMNMSQMVDPASIGGTTQLLTAKPIGDGVSAFELKIVAKDGHPVSLEISTRTIYVDGTAVGIQGIARDITERLRANEAVRESEERFSGAFEYAPIGVALVAPDGRWLKVNLALCELVGYEESELLAGSFQEITHAEDVDAELANIESIVSGEMTSYQMEKRYLHKAGQTVSVLLNVSLVRDPAGQPRYLIFQIQDMTERKHLEDQLRQSQKMEAVGVLAGGIAHDFNNLLTAINGFSSITLKRMPADDPFRHNIETILEAGERAAVLTSQLLAFSRKQVLKPRVYNLNAAITDIEKMLRRIIRENIEFRMVLSDDLGNVKADPGQIEQVLMNLAVNARDAMPNGGTLTIETQNVFLDEHYVGQNLTVEPGNFVKMTVSDTGDGMDESIQSRIFEPFYTTKMVGKGTGLGLSTVYGIVKQSGGDIMVYSEIGHGTTFKVYLPSVSEPIQRAKWIENQGIRYTGTETVLLVEDEDLVRGLVCEILKGNGYTVLEASGGKAGLEICTTYPDKIDMLITDVIMPGMGGSELKKQVSLLRPNIKVLFMSGYTDDSIAHRGIFESEIEFIEKPFSPDDLARKVREVIEY